MGNAIKLDNFFPGDTEVTLRPGYREGTKAETQWYRQHQKNRGMAQKLKAKLARALLAWSWALMRVLKKDKEKPS